MTPRPRRAAPVPSSRPRPGAPAPSSAPRRARMADCLAPSASSTAACLRPPALLIAACCSPSDFKMAARLCCSASFCSDIACTTFIGGVMSRISIRLSRTPHLAVASAMWSCMRLLIGLALGERLVQRELAEHGAQRRARELVDGELVVVDLEERRLHVDHLAEDGRADLQRDVVLRDDRLLVPGHRELAHVDLLHPVDERHRMCRPGWSTALNSPRRLTTPDAPLLDDLDEAGDEQGRHPDGGQDCDDDDPHHLASRCEQDHGVPL